MTFLVYCKRTKLDGGFWTGVVSVFFVEFAMGRSQHGGIPFSIVSVIFGGNDFGPCRN